VGYGKGIGIGIGAVAVIALIIVVYNSQTYDDARLANLLATYFDDEDRLVVAAILHNADGEFTKANGHMELTIVNENGREIYSNGYDFTKDDFLTWDNLFVGQQKGVPILINEMFPSGDYDVYVNLKTKSSYWEGLHATFYSFESDQQDTMQPIPEPIPEQVPEPIPQQVPSKNCSGNARCITGSVTQIIDGDTIRVDGGSIRFALTSTPELHEFGGLEAKEYLEIICPVGSQVLVDEDDEQTEGSYGRIVGVIYCNGMNLNEEILDADLGIISTGFCSSSEFSTHAWAQRHGCSFEEPLETTTPSTQTQQSSCDPSYPDFCIPPPPPDLDCGDIPQKRFTVYQPDPHRFDGDKDGIGCES